MNEEDRASVSDRVQRALAKGDALMENLLGELRRTEEEARRIAANPPQRREVGDEDEEKRRWWQS